MTNPNMPNSPDVEPLSVSGEDQEVIESAEIVGIEPSSAILAQRSIIAASVYWGIGYGDFSRGDPRDSPYMDP